MDGDFNWIRIITGIGVLTLCFVVLPSFFLWRDQRAKRREEEAGPTSIVRAEPPREQSLPNADRHAKVGP